MYWSTTTFHVADWSAELGQALADWKAHIETAHPRITGVRCYRYNGGTTVVWQEGFRDFRDYQDLIEEQDDVCETVMSAVFRHELPGTRTTAIWGSPFD
jgi:hypothetical protein